MSDGTVNDVVNSGNAESPVTQVSAHPTECDSGGRNLSCPRCRRSAAPRVEACEHCGFSFCETHSTHGPPVHVSKSSADAAPYDIESLVGTVIDKKYRVVEVLGEGGFGVVYKVEFLLFDERQEFALKILHPSLCAEAGFRRRFMREARLAMSFVHENAIQVRSFGHTDDGLLYFTMDLSSGESLKSVMRRDGLFSVTRAVHITRQILSVVRVAHRLGVLHRDLKPENIFVERDRHGNESVKVGDFGLAKSLHSTDDEITRGGIVGSPRYMSPEQLAGRKVDATTDLYSIGLLLYELLFGTVPQTEPVENDIARAALSRASKSTGAAGQEAVAPALLSVLGRALATERHVRHASAEAFLSALDGGSRSDALVGELRRAVRSRPFSLRTFALGAASLVLFSLILLLLPGEHGIKSTSPTNEADMMVGTSRVSAAVASEPIAVRDFAGLRAGVQYEYDVQMNQDGNTTRSRLRLEVVVNLDPGKFLVRAEPGGYEYFLVVDDEENALYRQFNLPDPETGERRLTRSRLLLRLPPTTFRVSKGRTFHCSSDDGRRLSVRLLDEPVTVHGRSFTGCIEVVDVGSGERQVRYYKSGKGEVATEVFDSATGVRLYSRVLLDDHESSF